MEKILDREVAWRIFAEEFNRSNLHIGDGMQRTPNYIITPTGVKCNRIFIVGVVTEVENIRHDDSLWKARIADPTGVFTIYAGQYQIEAAIFLSELKVPAYVAIVGKARTYEPEDGSIYVSVRPEEINFADEKQRDRWVLDTAERTLERIRIIEEALKSGLSGKNLKEFLMRRGTNAVLADGTVHAIEHYKNIDKYIEELKNLIISAVQTIAPDRPEKQAVEIREKLHEPEQIAVLEPKEALAALIDKLDTGKGTSYAAVFDAAISAGIDGESVESGIKELMTEGRCYESKIGVLRKV